MESGQVTNGALDSAREAVTLCLTMLGIMSFWCGILKVGEEAGSIEALTKKMRPVIRLLFPDMPGGPSGGGPYLHQYDRQYAGPGLGGDPRRAKGHGGTGNFGGGAEKAEKAGGLRKGNGQ